MQIRDQRKSWKININHNILLTGSTTYMSFKKGRLQHVTRRSTYTLLEIHMNDKQNNLVTYLGKQQQTKQCTQPMTTHKHDSTTY